MSAPAGGSCGNGRIRRLFSRLGVCSFRITPSAPASAELPTTSPKPETSRFSCFAITGEQMCNVRICEAKAQKQHLFRNQLSGQNLQESRAFASIELIVVFRDNHFRGMIGRTVHLVEHCVGPSLINA